MTNHFEDGSHRWKPREDDFTFCNCGDWENMGYVHYVRLWGT